MTVFSVEVILHFSLLNINLTEILTLFYHLINDIKLFQTCYYKFNEALIGIHFDPFTKSKYELSLLGYP